MTGGRLHILFCLCLVRLSLAEEEKIEPQERILIFGHTRTVTSYSIRTSIINTVGIRYCYSTIGTYATFSTLTSATSLTFRANGNCRKRRWLIENPIDLAGLEAMKKIEIEPTAVKKIEILPTAEAKWQGVSSNEL